MSELTLKIVGKTLFSADFEGDAAEVGQSLKRVLALFQALNRPIAQLVSPFRKVLERNAVKMRNQLATVLLPVVSSHRASPGNFDDMLSMLLAASDVSDAGFMSDDLLMDELLTLFLAGHETTANALTWTWYLLATNPEADSRFRAELRTVLAGRPPTLEDLPALPFVTAVFRESLRLYPPAWIIVREAVSSYRLAHQEVPAGATILMSTYATHRDIRFWKTPETFLPERWLEANDRPKFAYYPFGAGDRVCIGEHFAMMEGALVMATVAQKWLVNLIPGQTISLWPQITLRPGGSMIFDIKSVS